jgi:hypothetical protein
MGTWGHRNFDSDTAADHLSTIAYRLFDEVEKAMGGEPVELEPDEYWGVAVPCNLEIMALFAEQRWVGVKVPEPATLDAWKKKYLAIWDEHIEELEPGPAFVKARRAALVETFDRLMKASRRQHDDTPKKAAPKKAAPKKAAPKKAAPKKKTR